MEPRDAQKGLAGSSRQLGGGGGEETGRVPVALITRVAHMVGLGGCRRLQEPERGVY